MILNRLKTLRMLRKGYGVDSLMKNERLSVCKKFLSSAQPLHEDEYESQVPWPRRYRPSTSSNTMVTQPKTMIEQHLKTDLAPYPTREKFLNQSMSNASAVETILDSNEIATHTTETPVAVISPSHLSYSGDTAIPITSKLHIVTPEEDIPRGVWPVFRLMDQAGCFRDPKMDGEDCVRFLYPQQSYDNEGKDRNLISLRQHLLNEAPSQAYEINASGLLESSLYDYPDIGSNNTLWRIYRQTVRLREMDTILLNAQRQGRISFYMTCTGEEAIHMGTASALDTQDPILAQYREQGVIMWRGFTLEQFTNQCFSNDLDLGKGRQMPIHYGSRALNYHTISSPLGTQLPQAVGVAYRLKIMGKPNVAVAFFGEGCASTTDFHSAMNFAASLKAPCLFVCRNNGYAISTPAKEQFAGDGIVARAPGYGMAAIRVDGNDVFAVNAAVREAKKYALEKSAPVLIECITYRLGHHSSSDDSSAYRDTKEVKTVNDTADPLARLESFLMRQNWINESEIKSIRDEERRAVLSAFQKAEKRPKPSFDEMFEDVYYEITPQLQEQKSQLVAHMAKYPDYYQSHSKH